MRTLLLSVLVLSLSACSLLYRLPTRQGNVIDPRDVSKLQVGMTRDQVKFVMGTPVASNPFRDDRWDYFGYYKSPRGGVTSKMVSLYFQDGKLAKMEGVEQAKIDSALNKQDEPDVNAIINQVKEDKKDGTGRGTRPQPNVTPDETTPTPQGAP